VIKVYGIEIVKDAFDMANVVKDLNGLDGKLENILGDCSVELENVLNKIKSEKTPETVTTVILDPPRKGCEQAALQSILKYKADRIIYISCNPPTLARDIGILCNTLNPDGSPKEKAGKSNYNITFVQPYDMFPQTKPVETVVCLQRK